MSEYNSHYSVPFGGSEDPGEEILAIDIIFQRIPIANDPNTEQTVLFAGTSEDGFYNYQVSYTINVDLLSD